MKKLFLSLIIGVFVVFSSLANEHDNSLSDLPGYWWENVPSVCVPNATLWQYAQRKELQPLNMSYGKEGGKSDGKIVYIVTYWVGIDTNETMASVMVPNSHYSCILFRTFDVELNTQFDFNPKPNI